ncbi:MAG: hypothetical protein AAF666_12005 [Pseudomonadota bacterium]
MARNPGQSVEMLEVLFGRGERAGQAFVRTKFRADDRLWKNGLYCRDEPHPDEPDSSRWCGVECDGGTFALSHVDNDVVHITTRGGFAVGGACLEGDEGPVRYVTDEGAAKTVFRLISVDPESCR